MFGKNIALFLFAPLYLLVFLASSFSPRKNNRIIFGSWFGKKFDDSTKYLFLEAARNNDLDAYFVTKDKNLLSSDIDRLIYAYSIKGILMQLTARHFFCAVNSLDFSAALRGFNSTLTQVGHGLPIKRGFEEKHGVISKLKNYVRRSTIDKYDFIISNHQFFDEVIRNQWGICQEKIIEAPMARCDALFIGNNDDIFRNIDGTCGIIIYAPTHRDEGKTFLAIERNCKFLSELFSRNENLAGWRIMVKLHFYDHHHVDSISSLSNIEIVPHNIGANEAISMADILIADYSSIVFDYAHLNRPILCLASDYDEYSDMHRGLYFDLNDIFHKVSYNEKEFEDAISNAIINPDSARGLRIKFKTHEKNNSFSRQALASIRRAVGF